jgi:hypothetical protein
MEYYDVASDVWQALGGGGAGGKGGNTGAAGKHGGVGHGGGAVVVEVGSRDGLLALFAARVGAARVVGPGRCCSPRHMTRKILFATSTNPHYSRFLS